MEAYKDIKSYAFKLVKDETIVKEIKELMNL